MKRWLAWISLPILACAAIFWNRATSPVLLKDSDTTVLLQAVHERNDPLSWFKTDWPLANHFYRPISTLVFEFDDRTHPNDAAAFGTTNALLACACVLLLFWVLRETTEKPWLSGLASALFGAWHLSAFKLAPISGGCWILAGLALTGLLRGGKKAVPAVISAVFCLIFLSVTLGPASPFGYRILGWLPGRTASTMAVFALTSLAAYSRFERLGSHRRRRPQAQSTDVPATKGTESVSMSQSKNAWVWFVASVVSTALALASYEQAVMVPALLLGVAILFRFQGRDPRWKLHVCFWVVLVGYVALRSSILPATASHYQLQQFRNGGGVLMSIMDYLFPAWNWGTMIVLTLAGDWILLIEPQIWIFISVALGNVASWFQARRSDVCYQLLAYFLLAFVSYLPMAWLQPFGHYHYLPSAFRAVYVVLLATVSLKALTTAIGLPSLQAPKRHDPAPGSLLRP